MRCVHALSVTSNIMSSARRGADKLGDGQCGQCLEQMVENEGEKRTRHFF